MALYKVEWKQSAKKELKRLEKTSIQKILRVVENLSSEPHPMGSRKLQGSAHLHRVRVGDYRVIYAIESRVLIIEIIRVGHRKKIYRKLT